MSSRRAISLFKKVYKLIKTEFNMAKKRKKKDTSHVHHSAAHHENPANMEHAILKNLVELQKIHADLAEKFDKLAREISQMLALFEITARSFAKNAPPIGDYEKDRDFLEKIDKLLDQNKVLAKGLTLMEERLRERMYGAEPQQQQQALLSEQSQQKEQKTTQEEYGEYKPSLASPNRPLPKF